MNPKSTFIKAFVLAGLMIFTAYSSKAAGYELNGSAQSTGNNCYILTPDQIGQGGSVWYNNYLSLAYNFDMNFQVYLGSNDEGADGIAFVLQPTSTGLGGVGGGLGYLGITPSIAVEYDTWQNDDPWYDHIAIHKDGDPSTTTGAVAGPVQASASSTNIEDGQWHTTRITWDATTMTMTVYFDGVLRLTYSNDIVQTVFGGNPTVFFGFTGATGAASNLQQFCVTSLIFEEVPSTPLPTWALVISIFLILSVAVFRYRRSL
jgi:hypothetical protein